ncbi:hypothetical protein AB5J62_44165 [Amycolatopsis sp. cg5]|uniref:hypothetical protein n=1 Tax=Amycolatopsis sp. cg5 TaxID=3238802 RepID=UPI003523DDBC
MFPLDSRTVDRLAEVIVDMGGPYERKGYQLEELFRHAGLSEPPEYDGSPRIPWLKEQFTERQDNHPEIERLLCRVCDPIEYDDGMISAEGFRTVINEKLKPEQLVISYVGGRPVVTELGADGTTPMFTEPLKLEPRLRALIGDKQKVDTLMNRVKETRICENHGAYTMAVIGIGSIVEGFLLAILLERDEELRQKGFYDKRRKQLVKEDRATLEVMIDTAHTKGWIQLDAATFMHNVRNFRNFVHPRKENAEQPKFDKDTVMLCWAPVHALLNDLEETLVATSA